MSEVSDLPDAPKPGDPEQQKLAVWQDPAYEIVPSPLTGGIILKLKDGDGWRAYVIPQHEIIRFAGFMLTACAPVPANPPAASGEPAATSND